MSKNYIAQCKEFQSACLEVRTKSRRGLMREEDAEKAFTKVTA